ncbi:hypothetical protein ACFL6N_03845 [Thermodesulfobacteriota bacterium]
MKKRTCPFCREKIFSHATVCRFCRKEVPAPIKRTKRSGGVFYTLTATLFIATGAAIITAGFLKERRNWLKK